MPTGATATFFFLGSGPGFAGLEPLHDHDAANEGVALLTQLA
jgi:hypothetical protein